jgi:hypothetical protein
MSRLETVPAQEDSEDESDKHPKRNKEEAAAAGLDFRISRDFFGCESDVLEEENRFVHSYDDDPREEERDEEAETREEGMSQFGCWRATLFQPLHPSSPFHHINMDKGEEDSGAQSPALKKPPASTTDELDRFLEGDNEEEEEEEGTDEASAEFPRTEIEPSSGEFFREEVVGDESVEDSENSCQDPDFFTVAVPLVKAIKVAGDRADEERESEENSCYAGESLVRNIEHVSSGGCVEEVATSDQEVERKKSKERRRNEPRDEIISETGRFVEFHRD